MPQMSNLLWLPLMMFFTITMMITISNLFTYINYKNKTNLFNKSMKKLTMMTNLFSSFDPSTSTNFSVTLLFVILTPSLFWLIKSRFNIMFNFINKSLNKEFKMIMNNSNKSSTILFL